MKSIACALQVVLVASAIAQEPIDLSGTVTDTTGSPVAGAVVELLLWGLADTTGTDGRYALNAIPQASRSRPTDYVAPRIELARGRLYLDMATPQAIRLSLHDVRGRTVAAAARTLGTGSHVVPLPSARPGGIALVRARLGTTEYVWKLASIGPTAAEPSVARGSPRLAKSSMITDALSVTHPDYFEARVPVTKFDSEVDVSLTPKESPAKPNVGVIVVYHETEDGCSMPCREWVWNLSVNGQGMSTVRAAGVAGDTAWIHVPPGLVRAFMLDATCKTGGLPAITGATVGVPGQGTTTVTLDLGMRTVASQIVGTWAPTLYEYEWIEADSAFFDTLPVTVNSEYVRIDTATITWHFWKVADTCRIVGSAPYGLRCDTITGSAHTGTITGAASRLVYATTIEHAAGRTVFVDHNYTIASAGDTTTIETVKMYVVPYAGPLPAPNWPGRMCPGQGKRASRSGLVLECYRGEGR